MDFTLEQISKLIGGKLDGDETKKVHNIASIEDAGPGSITFLSNPKYEQHLYSSQATAIILKEDFQLEKKIEAAIIRVEDPYLAFTSLLEQYDKLINYSKVGIEEPAYFGENSLEGKDVYRGAFSYVGSGVKLGNNVKIHA